MCNFTDEIDNDEFLYRGVVENNWSDRHQRPASSTFSDSGGCSVDRDISRDQEECVEFMNGRLPQLKAIVKIQTSTCRALNTYPEYDPQADNQYHSLIKQNQLEIVIVSKSTLRKLRERSEIVFQTMI